MLILLNQEIIKEGLQCWHEASYTVVYFLKKKNVPPLLSHTRETILDFYISEQQALGQVILGYYWWSQVCCYVIIRVLRVVVNTLLCGRVVAKSQKNPIPSP